MGTVLNRLTSGAVTSTFLSLTSVMTFQARPKQLALRCAPRRPAPVVDSPAFASCQSHVHCFRPRFVQGYYAFFAVLNLGTLFFIWYTVPETKGRSLEEMNELFNSDELPGAPPRFNPAPTLSRYSVLSVSPCNAGLSTPLACQATSHGDDSSGEGSCLRARSR